MVSTDWSVLGVADQCIRREWACKGEGGGWVQSESKGKKGEKVILKK